MTTAPLWAGALSLVLLHEETGCTQSARHAARLLERGEGRIWRLSFCGESVDRPALTEAAERFGLKINLLHGYIDDIQGMPFGSLVVAATGDDLVLDAAAAFIESQDIRIEEVVL